MLDYPIFENYAFHELDTNTAVCNVSEVGDFRRFDRAGHVTDDWGLCPGVHLSGLSSENRSIPKAGDGSLRRRLIEAAQALGHSLDCAKKSLRSLVRQKGMDPSIVAYTDQAAARVVHKRSAMIIRDVNVNKATTSAAREMACFIWGRMTNNAA